MYIIYTKWRNIYIYSIYIYLYIHIHPFKVEGCRCCQTSKLSNINEESCWPPSKHKRIPDFYANIENSAFQATTPLNLNVLSAAAVYKICYIGTQARHPARYLSVLQRIYCHAKGFALSKEKLTGHADLNTLVGESKDPKWPAVPTGNSLCTQLCQCKGYGIQRWP